MQDVSLIFVQLLLQVFDDNLKTFGSDDENLYGKIFMVVVGVVLCAEFNDFLHSFDDSRFV